jgi:hypothetical protein
VKNKRSKSSNFYYDSTKNKRRKQEKMLNFYKQKISSPLQSDFLNQNNPHYNTGNNTSTRHIASPLIGQYSALDSEGSGFTYKRKEEKRTYLYGFTNSKFIYFLGELEPRAYLIFVTLIALLILEDLNQTEGAIIFAFISNIGDAMETVIEQEVILNSYHLQKFQREQGKALQKDFDKLYREINQLKKEMSHLKS